jgi:hypothetical protein
MWHFLSCRFRRSSSVESISSVRNLNFTAMQAPIQSDSKMKSIFELGINENWSLPTINFLVHQMFGIGLPSLIS